ARSPEARPAGSGEEERSARRAHRAVRRGGRGQRPLGGGARRRRGRRARPANAAAGSGSPRARPGRGRGGEGRLTGTPTAGRPPRVSLATRIFLGHAVVLTTFGLLALFSVAELHRNQQEIRLVSQGQLLAQDAAALDTFQRNQAQETAQIAAERDPETRAALARLAPLTFPPLLRARVSSL